MMDTDLRATRRIFSRSNSTNTTMAEKTKSTENIDKPMERLETKEQKKKKFSRAMSFDVRSLTSALKSNHDTNTSDCTKSSPKQKKSYTEHKHPSADLQEELHDLLYTVQYLGHVELKSPGLKDIIDTVHSLYSRTKPYLKTYGKALLRLKRDGITVRPAGLLTENSSVDSTSELGSQLTTEIETSYKPRRILYCGVDKQHQRVFSFNYQFGARAENIHLHVFVCKTKDDAKNIAKYLATLFKKISTDMHRKEKEDKKQHQEGLTKLISRSNSNVTNTTTYTNLTYPPSRSPRGTGSNEGTCSSGTWGSGEWVETKERERVQLSMA